MNFNEIFFYYIIRRKPLFGSLLNSFFVLKWNGLIVFEESGRKSAPKFPAAYRKICKRKSLSECAKRDERNNFSARNVSESSPNSIVEKIVLLLPLSPVRHLRVAGHFGHPLRPQWSTARSSKDGTTLRAPSIRSRFSAL